MRIERLTGLAVLSLFCAAALIAAFSMPASGAEKNIELRLAHQYPTGSELHQHIEAWTKKITADSKGKLTFRIYPVNTLVPPPQLYDAVVAGTADIAFGSRYSPKGYALGVNFPFILGAPNLSVAAKVYDDVWKKFPSLMAEEWKDVKVLWFGSATPQNLITRKAVKSLEDMKGLQLRAGSKEMGTLIKDLGAVPVFMSSADLAMSLEKGTIDGAVIQPSAIKDFKLGKKIKFILDVSLGTPLPIMCIINKDVYNGLPAELRAIVDKNGEFGRQGVSDAWLKLEEEDAKYCKSEGIETVRLSPQEQARWKPIIEKARIKAGAELDGKGIPGTDIVNYIKERIDYYAK